MCFKIEVHLKEKKNQRDIKKAFLRPEKSLRFKRILIFYFKNYIYIEPRSKSFGLSVTLGDLLDFVLLFDGVAVGGSLEEKRKN